MPRFGALSGNTLVVSDSTVTAMNAVSDEVFATLVPNAGKNLAVVGKENNINLGREANQILNDVGAKIHEGPSNVVKTSAPVVAVPSVEGTKKVKE